MPNDAGVRRCDAETKGIEFLQSRQDLSREIRVKLDENRQPRCARAVWGQTKSPTALAEKGGEALSCIVGNTTPSCNQHIKI